MSPSPTLLPDATNIGYAVYEDNEEKQLEIEGRDHGVIAVLVDCESLLCNRIQIVISMMIKMHMKFS